MSYSTSVVGCGFGGSMSLDALVASERFELVAACDQRADARLSVEERYPGIRTFASHQELFLESPTDVVCVSTWAPSHRDIAMAALDLGLSGILVEKPLADTTSEGLKLIQAIQSANIPVAVPHGLLVLDHTKEILRRVHDGEIGDLKLVEIQCHGWDIINAGIHWLNFFVALTQQEPMACVLAQCDTSNRTFRDGMQVETFGVTYAETQSGIRAVMNTGDVVNVNREGKGCLFRIVGTAGLIEFWAWEGAYILQNEEFPAGRHFEMDTGSRSIHQRHLELLADQMDEGRADYSIAESSLQALELVEGAYLSARIRAKVTFPLGEFTPPAPNDWDPGRPYTGVGGGSDGKT
jgi:predicted dehydrogenase